MKKFILITLAASNSLVFAATDLKAPNTDIGVGTNWTGDALPSDSNIGTLDENAFYGTGTNFSGFNIVHSAGILTRDNGNGDLNLGTGTTWTMNGTASWNNNRGIVIGAGSSLILQDGVTAANDNNSRDITINGAGALLDLQNGTTNARDDLIIRDGGEFRITQGSLNVTDRLFTPSFASTGGVFTFNGGTTIADTFELDTAGTATFGGSNIGNLELRNSLGSGVTLNFLTGTQMSLTIAGADETFYQGLYGTTLLFDGGSSGAFSENFSVTGDTLSIIPEPSSFVLMGLSGLAIFFV